MCNTVGQSCLLLSCVSALPSAHSPQNAPRPLSRSQPSGEQAYQIQTSGGFRLSSVLQKIEPGAPSGTPFAKCPIDVKYQKMWLFKIPGNKISTQQLSNGRTPHSVKQKPSAAWSGHRPLHTSSLDLCCAVPQRHMAEENGLFSSNGMLICCLPTEGSVAYLQKPHSATS